MSSLPRVMHGDWLELAAALPAGGVDLLYVDPPFGTGRTRTSPPRAGRVAGRVVDASYRDPGSGPAGGDAARLVAWLRARLEATRPALTPAASVLVHVDWRSSHRVRVMLDELFTPAGFVNHLVWCYGLGGSSPRRFARKHDDILFYTLDPRAYFFAAPRVPATSRRLRGQTKKMTDVLDVPAINNMSRERTGYPTQKPLALLELLVAACCPPGGCVLDPCCGSGTTLVAAARTGRRALGFDASTRAVSVSQARLRRCE